MIYTIQTHTHLCVYTYACVKWRGGQWNRFSPSPYGLQGWHQVSTFCAISAASHLHLLF